MHHAPIVYRPMVDLVWTEKPRASRTRWEECAVGESRITFGSLSVVREAIFRASCSRCLDWTWHILPRPDLSAGKNSRAWMCTRVS
jgi:hypothetical protein